MQEFTSNTCNSSKLVSRWSVLIREPTVVEYSEMPGNWKIYQIFFFYHIFKNMNLEDHLYFRIFFSTSILKHFTSFLKSCPIFDELTFLVFTKYVQWFILSVIIFGKKFCTSGPTSLKFHNRNDINLHSSL